MPVLIQEHEFKSESPPLGYVTHTKLTDGDDVIYGVFDTIDEAVTFGDGLTSAIVKPIYRPSRH